jgi:hypothetical protein
MGYELVPGKIKDIYECQRFCQGHPNCKYFAWVKEDVPVYGLDCWQMWNPASLAIFDLDSTIAGPKYCPY